MADPNETENNAQDFELPETWKTAKKNLDKKNQEKEQKENKQPDKTVSTEGVPSTSTTKDYSKKNPSINDRKKFTIDSKSALKGLNATVAGLNAFKTGTGALSNAMDTIRNANKAALNIDPLGTKTVTSTLNLTDKGFNDIQSTLTDTSNTMTSAKQNQKKIAATTNKIPNLNLELDRIYQEAIDKVGQGTDYEDMTPQQRQQVLETYETDMDDFLTGKIGDWSKLDPNSEEAKAIKKKSSEINNLESYAGRGQKLDQKQEKLNLKEKAQEQKDIKSDIRIDRINDKVSDLKLMENALSDPNASPDLKKMYDLAYKTDKNFMSKMVNGMFSDNMNKKMLDAAWNEYATSVDEDEKNILMDVITDLTWNRESLRDQKTDFANDIYVQKLMGNTSSVTDYLRARNRHDKQGVMKYQDPYMDELGIPVDSRAINQIQNEYLPAKKQQLLNMGLRYDSNKGTFTPRDPNKRMTKEQLAAVNSYYRDELLTDIALIRKEVYSNIDNMSDTKRFGKITKDKIVQVLKSDIDPKTGEPSEIAKKRAKVMMYTYVLQEDKDKLKTMMNEMFKNYMGEYDRNAKVTSRRSQSLYNPRNQNMKLKLDGVYNAIANHMNREFGSYVLHEVGTPMETKPGEIANLLLFDQNKKMDKLNATGNKLKRQVGRNNRISEEIRDGEALSPEVRADMDALGGVDTAKFVHGGIKGFSNKSPLDISMDRLEDFHQIYTTDPKIKKGSPEYKAAQARENRIVLTKMLYSISMDPNSSPDMKRWSNEALHILSAHGMDTKMNSTQQRNLRDRLTKLKGLDGYERSLNRGMGEGFDPKKKYGGLTPPANAYGNNQPISEKQYWNYQMDRLISPKTMI